MKKEEITKDKLIEFGFKITDPKHNPLYFCEKVLGVIGDADDDEEADTLSLVLTRERNIKEFAISTPDGTIFLDCSLETLAIIENAITGYESI
jgi:hypothetical protein